MMTKTYKTPWKLQLVLLLLHRLPLKNLKKEEELMVIQ